MNPHFQIEVGKTYTTAYGQKVEIVGRFSDLADWPYLGLIRDSEGFIVASQQYNACGRASALSLAWRDICVTPTVLRRWGLWWPTKNGQGPSLHLYTSVEAMENDTANQLKANKRPIAGPVLIETTVYL